MENSLSYGIKFKDKFGYALGDMGGLLSFSLVSSFLQMFYTDSLHIALGKITVLMIVARIWDAINDPIWGAFVDSRKPTKYGRFRPYIFWSSFPLSLGSVLMFTKIPGLSENQYLIFAYITYIFYGMMYTAMNIPYGSLASVMTDDENERSSLSIWRSIGAGIGGLPSLVFIPLFVYSEVAESGQKVLDSNKLFVAVCVLSVTSLLIFFGNFKLTKERVQPLAKQQQSDFNVLKTIKTLIRNKPFVVLCLISMLFIAFQMYTQTIYNYLLKNFYCQPGLYSIVTISTYLPMALFLPLMGKFVRRFGKKELCSVGILFSMIVNFIMFGVRFTSFVNNPYLFIILVFFSGIGQVFILFEVWALVMDVIDYQEYLSKRREEGTSYAFYSFARKLGHTVAGSGSAIALLAIGYDVNATEIGQNSDVLIKLYDISTLIPAIILGIIFVLFKFAYPLGKEELVELHNNLNTIEGEN